MTNPTTPFSWQMPTATDLVTDLPADFETFGQAVATSMADLLGGTTGQVLSKASNTDMDFTWVAQDDSNAIQNAIVDAKGDLITATAADTPARLAVGANDTVLTADSSTSTGLKWATASAASGPAFSAYRNTNQTVTANTATKVQLASEVFDTDNCFDSTTNYRFTPTKAGKYTVGLNMYISGSGYCMIYKNGSEAYRLNYIVGNEMGGGSVLIDMNGTTDYVEFFGYTAGVTFYGNAAFTFAWANWERA